MKIIIIGCIKINLIVYGIVIKDWFCDCKEIGKDNLAVSLLERLRATFLCITLPCIIGLVWRE